MKRYIILIIFTALPFMLLAQTINPRLVQNYKGNARIKKEIILNGGENFKTASNVLINDLKDFGISVADKNSTRKSRSLFFLSKKVYVVNLKMTNSIEGATQDDAFTIEVTPEQTTIEATTKLAMRWGCTMFVDMLKGNNGNVDVRCCKITDWGSSAERDMVFNAAESGWSLNDIKEQIKVAVSQRRGVFYLKLSDDNGWNYYTDLFEHVGYNPQKGKCISMNDINEILRICKSSYIEFIPVLDFESDGAFKNIFGHNIQSVEGMRFMNIIVDNLCKDYKGSSIAVRINENSKYKNAVEKRITDNGKEFILLE